MTHILTDPLHLIAYATDASAYREMPAGVAYPRNANDIAELIDYARQHHTHLIPRAGGTSIAGQVVGDGIVVDVSRYMNKILKINSKERYAWVEPGVVRDELNMMLRPYKLFFSPETSTSNRCCIGGMVGNNSCGTHSLVYGSTRHHVLELKGLLADGTPFSTASHEGSPLYQKIWQQLEEWQKDKDIQELLTQNFPDKSLQRRSCGYAIDEAIATPLIDLCKLLTGSEGTLAFITAIKISLYPLPHPNRILLCAHCNSLQQSYLANITALRHSPVAVELMDGKILELSKSNHSLNDKRFFIQGDPAALIIAELTGDDADQRADTLEQELLQSKLAYHCSRVYGNDIDKVWALRKAGLGVLTGIRGSSKPVGVVEDTAVAPQRLPEYLADFDKMLQSLSLSCVYYGHIGTGELHLRPILDMKKESDRILFRQVAQATALLVKKHHGSLSGEHGDGRLRGEFIPIVYGYECYQLMRRLKQCWDPYGVFNRGKIVDTPPMDSQLRYDANQRYTCTNSNLMDAIEQCNGAADCRKSSRIGGTMCPTYKATHDELLSTRARTNILRELLTRGDNSPTTQQMLKTMLDSCLACKGCKSECPSNVDMAAIRSQVLQQIYSHDGTPLRSAMVARMAMIEKLGHIVWPVYNFFATNRHTSSIIKHIVGFAPERSIPTLSHKTTRQQIKRLHIAIPAKTIKQIYLFTDEFTNYQEASLGVMFYKLLTLIGYRVTLPKHAESGRAAMSKGCIEIAARHATRNVKLLSGIVTADKPLIGIEPSCILSFRDEYPTLVSSMLHDTAVTLGSHSMLYDEFLIEELRLGNISSAMFTPCSKTIYLHGHCHQKAIVGTAKTATLLATLLNAHVETLPTGCCGMAGSYGYEKEHYTSSIEIANTTLVPSLHKIAGKHPDGDYIVAAPGTSCRTQIHDTTGIQSLHPIEILYNHLKK